MDKVNPQKDRLPRKLLLQWFATTTATLSVGEMALQSEIPMATSSLGKKLSTEGYGTDPKLNKIYQPGDVWELSMTASEKKIATVLADIILPADDLGPAASSLRVPDYIDEWISAPYPKQQRDRQVILKGFQWLDSESVKRFKKGFASLHSDQQIEICDDICYTPKAKPEHKQGAHFFMVFKNLSTAAYYSTPEGWESIGYVGNTPLASFDGPPESVLKQLGVVQTVK